MSEYHQKTLCTAFQGSRRIASGELRTVAVRVKEALDRGERAQVLIFDDIESRVVELDFRGTAADVLRRLPRESLPPAGSDAVSPDSAGERRGPGRPRLGVVAREVTLLPRHWEWLNSQPGGASVALRKLVEEARRAYAGRDRLRNAQESAYRFISAMAGNEPGFEEATRALFAGAADAFHTRTAPWPPDVREHARRLAAVAFRERAAAGSVVPFPGRHD